MPQPVQVLPYDPQWPVMFEKESSVLTEALGNNCLAIHHIGSTSIPGLPAKPIIDILPVVKDIRKVENSRKEMEQLGYEVKGEYGIAFRRFFQKGKDSRTHNVHVFEEGNPEINRYLKFRDWMRSHQDDAQAYAELKLELAKKFPNDILNYCLGKDAFVANIDAKDGFKGWRIVQALTDREWTAVYAMRQQLDTSPNLLKNKEHIHFVYYKESDIIGYAHLELLPENDIFLQMLVIDTPYRKQGFGKHFLELCRKWANHQGLKPLQTESTSE